MASNRDRRTISQPQCYKLFNEEGRVDKNKHEQSNLSLDNEVSVKINHASLHTEIRMANTLGDKATPLADSQSDEDAASHQEVRATIHDMADDKASSKEQEVIDKVELHAPQEDFGISELPVQKTPHRRRNTTSRKGQHSVNKTITNTRQPFSFNASVSELEAARKENEEAEHLLQKQQLQAEILQEHLQAEEK